MAEQGAHSIGTRTVRGMFWAYGSYVGGRVLSLVATAILARLLAPDEFGLVALALVFISLLETVSDLGLGQALVLADEKQLLERAETVFVFSLVLGGTLTILTAAVGPLAANFFDEDELVGLLPLLGSTFLLRAFGSTHYALAQKRLDFRSRTAAEVAEVVVRGVTSIVLALAGLGAYSLVIGYLAGTVTLNIVLWALVRWRPHFRARRSHLRQMLSFGGTLTGVNAVAAVIANIDYMWIGRVLGAAELGLYSLGFRLPELLILNLSVVTSRVLFPAFASVDRAALGHAFLVSLRYTLMIGVPLAAGLAILAEPVILTVFGEKWRGSIEPMQVLAVYALSVTVGIPGGTAYKASGRADVLLALAIPRLAMLVVGLVLFADDGIVAVAACQAVTAVTFDLIGIVLASRLLNVGLRAVLGAAWPAFAASAGMSVVLGAIALTIEANGLALATGVVAGGAAYLGLLLLLARDSLRGLLETAFPAMAGAAPEPAAPQTTHEPDLRP